MTWTPGQSGNPTGRRAGSRNKSTSKRAQLRAALERKSASVLKKAIEMAEAGDATVMNALLDRLLPKLKPVEREIHAPLQAGQSAEQNAQAVLAAMVEGTLSIEDGQALIATINDVSSLERLGQMERAIADLFRALGKEPPAGLSGAEIADPKKLQ